MKHGPCGPLPATMGGPSWSVDLEFKESIGLHARKVPLQGIPSCWLGSLVAWLLIWLQET